MKKVDWAYVCLSVTAGLMLGISVGLVGGWMIGIAVGVVWLCMHAVTEGFNIIPSVPDEIHFATRFQK